MFTYFTPAHIDDLADRPEQAAFLDRWHNYILKSFRDNIGGLGPAPLFFSEVDTPATLGPVAIPWNAFPLMIQRQFGEGQRAWRAADALQSTTGYTPQGSAAVTTHFRPQDEYCEWFAYKTSDGKISRIVFTSEAPEYWIHLAEADIDLVVELYQQYVDPAVQKVDLLLKQDIQFDADTLLRAGTYDPYNVWNTERGAMHLTHPANTLGAEINLAAFATPTRKDIAGERVTDVRRLICCAGYGVANRSSDPSIGWNVNVTCTPITAGASVNDATLANPVALYMNGLQAGKIAGPSGEAIDDWFQFKRGAAGMGLMTVLAPPPGSTFGLDQVTVKGVPLQYGGQVAEVIDMVLYANAKPRAAPPPPAIACVGRCCMPAGTAATKIPSINLNQPRDGAACSVGEVNAYPEIAPAVAQGSTIEVAVHPAVRPTRSRLAK